MKVKFTLEYPMKCSPLVLFPRLSTPGGLSEWFADDVNVEGKFFVFFWDKSFQRAELLYRKENHFCKFRWEDEELDSAYFEFRIISDELTGDVSLLITDFAEEEEKEDAVQLWNSQIVALKHCVGV